MQSKVIRLDRQQIAQADIQNALDDAMKWIQGPIHFITQSETATGDPEWETFTITIFYGD